MSVGLDILNVSDVTSSKLMVFTGNRALPRKYF